MMVRAITGLVVAAAVLGALGFDQPSMVLRLLN
jgi:hypothetical protein